MRPLIAIQEMLMQRSFPTSAVVTCDHSDARTLKRERARRSSASATSVKKDRTVFFPEMVSF